MRVSGQLTFTCISHAKNKAWIACGVFIIQASQGGENTLEETKDLDEEKETPMNTI